MKSSEIKKVRNKLGLTQKEFGQLLGVHFVTVSNWEKEGPPHPTGYQQDLIKSFDEAAERDDVKGGNLGKVLVGVGVVAALALLLKHLNIK